MGRDVQEACGRQSWCWPQPLHDHLVLSPCLPMFMSQCPWASCSLCDYVSGFWSLLFPFSMYVCLPSSGCLSVTMCLPLQISSQPSQGLGLILPPPLLVATLKNRLKWNLADRKWCPLCACVREVLSFPLWGHRKRLG